MIPCTLKIYDFLLVFRFHGKIIVLPKNALNLCATLAAILQYTDFLGDVIDIKLNA